MTSRLKIVTDVAPVEPPALLAQEATLSPRLPHRLPFRYIEPLIIVGDFVIILLASLVSGIGYQRIFLGTVGDIDTFLAIGVLVFINFSALTSVQQNYRPTKLTNLPRQLRYVTLTWWGIFLVLVGVAFTLKVSGNYSRGATLSFFILSWLALASFRYGISRHLLRALECGGFAEKKIILIAETDQLNNSRSLIDLRRCGYLPIRTYEISPSEIDSIGFTKSLQSKIDDIASVTQQHGIEHVVLLFKWSRSRLIDTLVGMLRIVPIPVHLVPDENVSRLLESRLVDVGTAWTIELQRAPLSVIEQAFKRGVDLIAAVISILLFSPLLLIAALLIKIDSSGPVLFRQKRNGFNGRTFVIYKFRTMCVLEDGNNIAQAVRNDPRVTRIGRWLRQTSIDELPQLFNVISGTMSLVGPRPHAIAHNDEYSKVVSNYAFRHHMKPGITGWAQVNGFRGQTQTVDVMAQRVEYDLWYINHWSLWLDLKILLKTLVLAYHQPMAY